MINGIGIVGFRDPNGIRPLVFGTREKTKASGTTKDYVVSSESVVMDMLGFKLNREMLCMLLLDLGGDFFLASVMFLSCLKRECCCSPPIRRQHGVVRR